ncbi:hypothetical protein AAHZ94_34545, partial [Streptomyces sp. HSW2009]
AGRTGPPRSGPPPCRPGGSPRGGRRGGGGGGGGEGCGGGGGAGRGGAVAGGSAFTFSYAEHAELLTAAGAEVVTFDPLHDTELPAGTRGLVIGGGFPEVYAAELSANAPLRAAVAALAASGAPIAAECAGLLYLARSLDPGPAAGSDSAAGAPLPMCGVLPAEARMSGRLTLGYREAVALSPSALLPVGARVRGHEFHRTVITPEAGGEPGSAPDPAAGPASPTLPAWGVVRPARRVEGFVRDRVHASYLHLHWAATPAVAASFVQSCTP